jgi:predicted transcriptional regulator YdeE
MKYIVRDYQERFYVGLEHTPTIKQGVPHKIPELWQQFMSKEYPTLNKAELVNNFIGLECYPPDFMESREFDYFCLVESKFLINMDGFISKKLPKGKYISFEIAFETIHDDIQNVYKYVKEHKMNIHYGFDYEEYLMEEDYNNPGAKLYFSLLLEND